MSRSGSEIRSSETQCKLIQDRIGAVEKHFGDLCINFAAYTRKNAKLRDRGDDIATCLRTYAENSSHNHTTQSALTAFTENFSAVQDYRNAQNQRLEDRVLGPLERYGNTCKVAKETLKKAFVAHNKELKERKNLLKVRQKAPSDRHTISEAETDLQKASVDASRSSKGLEEEMDNFEKRKLQDTKKMLQEFVNIEMVFHAKALEMYTQCFQNLNSISEEEDLEEFRNSLRLGGTHGRLELHRSSSKTSLNSTMNNTTSTQGTPMQGRRPPPAAFTVSQHSSRPLPPASPGNTPNRVATPSQRSSMYSDDNGQDDDSDDDDSEDETDDDEEEEEEEEIKPIQKNRRK